MHFVFKIDLMVKLDFGKVVVSKWLVSNLKELYMITKVFLFKDDIQFNVYF